MFKVFGHKNTKYLQILVTVGARYEIIGRRHRQNFFIEMSM